MTQEEKQLLLKDFCTRLPYGVMFDYNNNEPLKVEGIVRDIVYFKGYNYQTEGDECYAYIIRCKPYLRPMSSMTEEEKKDYNSKFEGRDFSWEIYYGSTDWLNEHHFDYRGLIPMGLALPAPEGMYN